MTDHTTLDGASPRPPDNHHDHVVITRGNSNTKAHRPHPDPPDDHDAPYPWCLDTPFGMTRGGVKSAFTTWRLAVAREWRTPCQVCYPEGYPDPTPPADADADADADAGAGADVDASVDREVADD